MPIADGELVVTVGGETLTAATPLTIYLGRSYQVAITRTGNSTFRGILARLDGGDSSIDTTEAFSLREGETDLQISDPCVTGERVRPDFLLEFAVDTKCLYDILPWPLFAAGWRCYSYESEKKRRECSFGWSSTSRLTTLQWI